MRLRLGFASALLLFAATLTFAQPLPNLPEFSGKWYATVVYSSPMSKDSAALHTFIHNDPSMQRLLSATNFNEYTDATPLISQTNWQTFLGAGRPAFLLQGRAKPNNTADVVFFAQGRDLKTGKTLVDNVRKALAAYAKYTANPAGQRWRPFQPQQQNCPDGRCPIRPQPQPQPQPAPVTPPTVVVPITPTVDVDVDTPDAPAEEDGLPLLAILLPVLAGLGAGAYSSFKK